MSVPWWRSFRGVAPLIEVGGKQGYVTVDQLNEVLLPDATPDMIEDVRQALNECGIHVVEGDDQAEE